MEEFVKKKVCKRCKSEKELNTDNWYVQRARIGHPTQSWQSNCKTCWQEINRENKIRRRLMKRSNAGSGLEQTHDHTSAPIKSEQVA